MLCSDLAYISCNISGLFSLLGLAQSFCVLDNEALATICFWVQHWS